MKNRIKRSLAWALLLALCLSLLPASGVAAQEVTVDYVYAGDYIKNWGTRGNIATFMSPNGERFYEDNRTSYEELASLSGSAVTGNVPASPLYKALRELMVSNHSYITTYDATRSLYQYTDCQESGTASNKISAFYSGIPVGPAWDGGSTWNREHTWPNSKGLNGQDENDIMMLRPTSVSENSSRNNTAYGAGVNYYDPDEYGMRLHGDVARIMLYQYVRWGNTAYMWGERGVMESREVLLQWMEEDPVDTWELGRNDAVESITGTRNVFVDYPELAFVLFGAQVPMHYVTPSGSATDSSHTITAVPNDPAWGAVFLSGSTVNATPATGYEISGYTLLSGTAEVTRSGNAFLVKSTTDVKLQVNFAPRPTAAVQFQEYDRVAGSQTVYVGEMITLPSHTGTVQTGHTFVGWVESVIQDATALPAIYGAGSQYTVTENRTLYALYSRNESGAGSSNVFQPYSGKLTEGDYIVVYKNPKNGDAFAMAAKNLNGRLQHEAFNCIGTDIVAPDGAIIWHIAPSENYWTMYNAEASVYAGGTGAKNKAGLLTSLTDYAKWSVTGTDNYVFINKGNKDKGVNPRLTQNGSVGFACYADSNNSVGGPLSLYKRVPGTVYYFTGGYRGDPVGGDLDGNGRVTEDDAIYLLQHVLMPELFAVSQSVDYDGNGTVNEDDAIYLLQHVLMPDLFPLS